MALQQTISRLIRQFRPTETKVSRGGMPNGFFFSKLLWFGDAGSRRTAVARGIIVEPGELGILDEETKTNISDRLRILIGQLGDEYTVQARYLVCRDYAEALERYRRETEAIKDKWRFRWQIWNRTERYERYRTAMEEGKLRREVLVLFFSRVIDTDVGFSLSETAMQKYYEGLARREADALDQIVGGGVRGLFPDCRVQAMTDEQHYLYYYRFLNPNIGSSIPADVMDGFDASLSIQENCLFGDVVQPLIPGVSFGLDGFHHAVLVMRELPRRIGPGVITRLTDLGFVDYEVVVNLYPRDTDKVIKTIEAAKNQLMGEANTRPKQATSLGTQAAMAERRVVELEQGSLYPVDVFLSVRLWARDPETVIARAAIVKNAFVGMHGAIAHHATNPETARQIWYQTWPGWTYGTYRGFDLGTDDRTAADLLPWSSSFCGRLEIAEALYDSAKGGLVGVATAVGRTPQNMLWYGVIRGGKSLFFTDLWAQIGHNFGFVLIVEEGLSHGTTVETAGGHSIILSANGSVTINYLDPAGILLTSEHFGGCVALCLQMLREGVGSNVDQSKVSVIEGILSKHLNLLYDESWRDWVSRHPEEANTIARRAYGVEKHFSSMGGEDNTYLDAWVDLRDWEARDASAVAAFLAGLDEEEISRYQTSPASRVRVRNVGFSYLSPEEMPTHTQLVELLTLTPIGGQGNSEAVMIGDRLGAWRANGRYGPLFDGVMSSRVDADVTHFDLTKIADGDDQLKAAAHFLILNLSRQKVIKRPRAERKLIFFEEAARLIQQTGGAKALKEYYAQMGKFGAVVGAVFQQITALKSGDLTTQASIRDNTKLTFVSAQPSPQAADEIASALELSTAAKEAIKHYPSPEHQTGRKFGSFLMCADDPRRRLVGTLRNIATPEVVYCGASNNETFDRRKKALSRYDDVVQGIIAEARKEERQNEA
jgi:type IV secretion system protein TrbE